MIELMHMDNDTRKDLAKAYDYFLKKLDARSINVSFYALRQDGGQLRKYRTNPHLSLVKNDGSQMLFEKRGDFLPFDYVFVDDFINEDASASMHLSKWWIAKTVFMILEDTDLYIGNGEYCQPLDKTLIFHRGLTIDQVLIEADLAT